MTPAVAMFLAGVVMASTAQILMKTGALRSRDRSVLRSFLHPYVIAGYILMLVTTVISTIALKVLPLHVTVSILPLGYLNVVLLSVVVLREKMRRHQVLGVLVILGGIIVFNLDVFL